MGKPDRARSPYACACVYMYTARRRHPKTAKKGAVTLFKPYKAVVRHFMGAVDRFYVRHLFVSYKGIYGRGSAWEECPPTPPKGEKGIMGGKFSRDLYFIKTRIIITGGRDEEIRVFYDR